MRKTTLIADKRDKTGKIIVRGSFDNGNKILSKLWLKQHRKRIICDRMASESRRINVYKQKG